MSKFPPIVMFLGLSLSWSICLPAQLLERAAPRAENNEATADKLNRLYSPNLEDVAFDELLAQLETQFHLDFYLDESAVENNLDSDQLITLNMAEMRLATCLELIFREFQCTYTIKDGIVWILSEDAALDNLSLRVFDCRDLISRLEPKKVFINSARHLGGGQFSIGLGSINLSDFGVRKKPDQENQPGQIPQREFMPTYEMVTPGEQVMEMFTEIVDPDSWEENGGCGRLYEVNGLMVVTQTDENLRAIDFMLSQIMAKQH